MNSSQEISHYAWQSLHSDLEEVRQHWNDSTTEHFLSYYWQPLETESGHFQRALEHLTAVLDAALRVAY